MTSPAVLVVNAGSSSLKVKLLPQGLSLLVERLGGAAQIKANFAYGSTVNSPVDHGEALEACLKILAEQVPLQEIGGVGHRVVHGGERYVTPALLTPEVITEIEQLSNLAPLHNPTNLKGIRAAQRLLPGVPHVAVFDTAFHGTLPKHAFLYGIPRELYEQEGIRKYGFHGTSHDYVTRRGAECLGRARQELKLVSLHLGNGASATAVMYGRSVDTSMGLTPLDGLLMGTRSGRLDPGVVLHLLRNGRTPQEVDTMLNKASGLLGLSMLSNDMRDLRRAAAAGHTLAQEALAVFTYRIRITIGAYAAAMGGLDAVVFTGGIGENDAHTRAEAVTGLDFLGVSLDPQRNQAHETEISSPGSRVKVLVVPTDEEAMIAEAVRQLL